MRKKIRVLLHSCQLQGSHWAVAGGHRVRKEDCGGEVGRNEEMGSSGRRRDEDGAGEWQVTPRIPHEVIGWTVTEWNRVTEGEVGWEKLTWGFRLQASRDVRREQGWGHPEKALRPGGRGPRTQPEHHHNHQGAGPRGPEEGQGYPGSEGSRGQQC